jgi:hypothetical protein
MASPLENQVQQDMAALHIASPNSSHDSGENTSQTSQSESSESAPMPSNQSPTSADNLLNMQIPPPDPSTLGVLLAGLERIIAANAEFNRESNRQLFEQLRPKPKTKVYLSQPEFFQGTIGQEVERWLNNFNMWFKHRENAGETIEESYKIESAIMRTTGDTNSALTVAHQKKTFATWADFEKHMLVKYSSNDTAYTRYVSLCEVTQRSNESVTSYYQRFQVALGRLLQPVPLDANFIHVFDFVRGLDGNLRKLLYTFPESRTIETLDFQGVFDLVKRAEISLSLTNPSPMGPQPSNRTAGGPIRTFNVGGTNRINPVGIAGSGNKERTYPVRPPRRSSEGPNRAPLTDVEKDTLRSICAGAPRLLPRTIRKKAV